MSLKSFVVGLFVYQKEQWENCHLNNSLYLVGIIGIPEVHLEVKGDNGDLMGIMSRGQMLIRWSDKAKWVWLLQ